jgi:hypothetical protein
MSHRIASNLSLFIWSIFAINSHSWPEETFWSVAVSLLMFSFTSFTIPFYFESAARYGDSEQCWNAWKLHDVWIGEWPMGGGFGCLWDLRHTMKSMEPFDASQKWSNWRSPHTFSNTNLLSSTTSRRFLQRYHQPMDHFKASAQTFWRSRFISTRSEMQMIFSRSTYNVRRGGIVHGDYLFIEYEICAFVPLWTTNWGKHSFVLMIRRFLKWNTRPEAR